MKYTNFCLFALLLGAFSQLRAQGDDAAQKAWMAYMTPGPVHKMVAKSDGEWKADLTMWMAPGAAPTTSTASCTNKMILGGRYQESKYTGTFMGMPFEGVGMLAYDNAKKVFVSSWVDNMGTGMMTLEGPWDDNSKSVTLLGKSVDPMTGKDMNVRQVFKIIDDNAQQLDMYMQMNGQEFKTMEIKLTRK
ncbi:MAG TPA: DUF1579 domain-containing protein [Puia sp.]